MKPFTFAVISEQIAIGTLWLELLQHGTDSCIMQTLIRRTGPIIFFQPT
jgi:hypothetical protein